MLLGKLAIERWPHYKNYTLSSNKAQKLAARLNGKAKGGGGIKQQESM